LVAAPKKVHLLFTIKTLHMKKGEFKVLIDAPRKTVWEILWDDATYREWTTLFCEGSYYVTDWKEGSKALFLSPSGEGMVSKIEVNTPNEFMSIRHLGEVKNGVEDTESEKIKAWAGAYENYYLTEVGDKTELRVEMDMTNEFADYFVNTWPKALEKIKEIAERKAVTAP
jgi:hypothetical protein